MLVAFFLYALPFLLAAALTSCGMNPYLAAGMGLGSLFFIFWCFAKDE